MLVNHWPRCPGFRSQWDGGQIRRGYEGLGAAISGPSIQRSPLTALDTHPLTSRLHLRPGAKREITLSKTPGHAQPQYCSSSLAARLWTPRSLRWNSGASFGPLAERPQSARLWSYWVGRGRRPAPSVIGIRLLWSKRYTNILSKERGMSGLAGAIQRDLPPRVLPTTGGL